MGGYKIIAVRALLTSLSSLLEVTVDSHAGETENRGLDHLDDWLLESQCVLLY